MKPTTVEVSVETRERLGAQVLESLEVERFWAEAEAAAAWRQTLSADERAEIESREADAWGTGGGQWTSNS